MIEATTRDKGGYRAWWNYLGSFSLIGRRKPANPPRIGQGRGELGLQPG